jgi:hypothetical protein
MFEQVFYLAIVAAGIVVALATRDDTFVWVVGLVGVICLGFFGSLSIGTIIWVLSAIGAGVLVSYAAADELHDGRRWFMVILGISLVLMIAGIVQKSVDLSNLAGILAIFSGISFAMSFTKIAKKRTSKI